MIRGSCWLVQLCEVTNIYKSTFTSTKKSRGQSVFPRLLISAVESRGQSFRAKDPFSRSLFLVSRPRVRSTHSRSGSAGRWRWPGAVPASCLSSRWASGSSSLDTRWCEACVEAARQWNEIKRRERALRFLYHAQSFWEKTEPRESGCVSPSHDSEIRDVRNNVSGGF